MEKFKFKVKIFTNNTTEKEPLSLILKELLEIKKRKTKKPVEKWAKDMKNGQRPFTEKEVQMTVDLWRVA